MKTRIIPILLSLLLFISGGCDELKQIAQQADSGRPLTRQEVVRGLRQALVIGSDSAAARLSATDGYYGDEMVRIMLPPDAEIITNNLSYLPGGEQLVEDLILRINRAAEQAAKEAAPVFAGAIAGMSIQDGFEILRGDRDAATQYLKDRTWEELYGLYQPKIRQSMDRAIVGDVSATEAWNTLTSQWNRLASSTAGRIANLEPVNTELDSFLTDEALNGLFLKLAEEEARIRTRPEARVTELLQRVFGSESATYSHIFPPSHQ